MGFFDRFRSKKGASGSERKPKHIVRAAPTEHAKKDEEARASFRAATAGQKTDQEKPHAHGKRPAKEDTGRAPAVLLRPIVTEKSSAIAGSLRQYTFAVAPDANKIEVRKAVQAVYGVLPRRVSVRTAQGKAVRYGRTTGRTRLWKKAIVVLPPGEKIEIGEG